jgi:hypothetical protein
MESGEDAQREALRALAKTAFTLEGDSERPERIVLAIRYLEECIEALIQIVQLYRP